MANKLDFKVLPTMLDYMWKLEQNSSSVSTAGQKGPANIDTTTSPKTKDGFFYLYVDAALIKALKLEDALALFKDEWKTGVYIKTPFKQTAALSTFSFGAQQAAAIPNATRNAYGYATPQQISEGGNTTLCTLLLIYLSQRLYTLDPELYKSSFVRNVFNMFPYSYGATLAEARQTIISILRRSINGGPIQDIKPEEIRVTYGGTFYIKPGWGDPLFRPSTWVETFYVNDKYGTQTPNSIIVDWGKITNGYLMLGTLVQPQYFPAIELLVANSWFRNCLQGTSASKTPLNGSFSYFPIRNIVINLEGQQESEVKTSLEQAIVPFFYILGDSSSYPEFANNSTENSSVPGTDDPSVKFEFYFPYNGQTFLDNTTETNTPLGYLQAYGSKYQDPDYEVDNTDPSYGLFNRIGKFTEKKSFRVGNEKKFRMFKKDFLDSLMGRMVPFSLLAASTTPDVIAYTAEAPAGYEIQSMPILFRDRVASQTPGRTVLDKFDYSTLFSKLGFTTLETVPAELSGPQILKKLGPNATLAPAQSVAELYVQGVVVLTYPGSIYDAIPVPKDQPSGGFTPLDDPFAKTDKAQQFTAEQQSRGTVLVKLPAAMRTLGVTPEMFTLFYDNTERLSPDEFKAG